MEIQKQNSKSTIPMPQYRSDEVDEILSEMPNWTVRWGLTLILAVLLMLLSLGWFLKYPDIIKGTISISSDNPPVSLVAQSTGMIEVLVEDKSIVQENQTIAYIKNTAKYEDVVLLKQKIDSLKKNNFRFSNASLLNIFNENYQLGEIQVPYNNFLLKLKEQTNLSIREKNNTLRKMSISEQVQQLTNIENTLLAQKKILENEYAVLSKTFETRYKPLHKAGSISTEQLEQKNNELLQKAHTIESLKTNISENRNKIINLQGQSVEYDFEQKDKELNSSNLLFDAFTNLSNQIETWVQKYEIKSPINGRINFKNFLKNNTFLKQNDEIASVIPQGKPAVANQFIGELFIDTQGSGKVQVGQSVNIYLENYPKKEFGILKGKILSIADISTDLADNRSALKANVELTDGLRTTSHKNLTFRNGMKGRAEVITKDLSFIERLFDSVRNAFEK